MMLHSKDHVSKLDLLRTSRVAFVKQFGRDEEGGIIILTILLLIVMLVLGGMAVDFMRFESRRSLLQSVSDRAVLSAASLDQSIPADEVVVDFFEKSGFGGTIIGTPDVTKEPGLGASRVEVNSEVDVSTFYLRLIGIDELTAPARSLAVQGAGNIEISLVLDISGSMRNEVTAQVAIIDPVTGEPQRDADGNVMRESQQRTKISLLQDAAEDFIDELLIEDYKDLISINLIAYSQQVAIDDDLFKRLNITPDSISSFGQIGSSYGAENDDGTYSIPDDPETPVGIVVADGEEVFVNPSRCIDFEAVDFNQSAFNVGKLYDQVEYFEHYSDSDEGIDYPVCPEKEFESILLMSQDAEELKRRINLYRPTSFTSIHLGVKWGISLLDPSMRPILTGINSIDPAFRGSRPAEYSGDTLKYMIVMTDGVNVASRRIDKEEAYDTYEERVRWSQYPMDYWRENIAEDPVPSRDDLTNNPGSFTLFNTWMETLCDYANDVDNARPEEPPITIYTIAMGAGSGAEQIAKCASDPLKAFETDFLPDADEPGIDQIFETIAQQIKALRLTQ